MENKISIIVGGSGQIGISLAKHLLKKITHLLIKHYLNEKKN
jgi:hypothetical protein